LLKRVAASLFLLVLAPPSRGGWASLGPLPPPAREEAGFLFRSGQGVLRVTALSPEVVRVRFAPATRFGRDHSYAVVSRALGRPGAVVSTRPAESVLRTPALVVTIRHDPPRLRFATPAGEVIDEDDPELGTAVAGRRTKVWKRLRDDEHVYGFGEKAGRLDKRGWNLGGYGYVMWNTDTYAWDAGTDPLYASVPFFMVLRQGRAHGIFLDNTHRATFDVGRESRGLLSFGAEAGELDYYFIDGPSPAAVLERYAALTGRMPLPPRWALGYHQCRYSYYPESRVRFIAESFRQRRIPADVLWLDIHYLDGYDPFTWDRERFPDPAGMIADLGRRGFRVVTILDPHPKKAPGEALYEEGRAGGHFVRNPDGSVYEGPVWPSQAPPGKAPGPSVFPDFSRPAAREWWGGLHRRLTDLGVAGIWNDMNEPAVFSPPSHSMPLDVRHDNEGEPTDHREIHNVYGMLMTRATHEGLLRLRPDERPFVLTRATFAGGQRYAAVWPGDNVSDWSALAQSLPTLMGLGLSGFPFVGADIGGFAESPSAELFTRWLQAGVFYPFMRTHTTVGTPDQEPWSYGTRHEALNRRAIELRYEMLPHLYAVMEEASRTGLPALRPLFLDFPGDERTYGLNDQFLFGRDLLVAPVLREAATAREVYLPGGDWYDFWTGRRLEGGGTLRLPVTLESIPVFARAGAFVFMQDAVQHTGEMAGRPLHVRVYPALRSAAALYEDDGLSLAHLRGVFARRRFSQVREGGVVRVEVSATEGSYRPAPRDVVLLLRLDGVPSRVRLDGGELFRRAPSGEQGEADWTLRPDGFVEVRLSDRPEAFVVTVER
jgi:alpha-glucosidase